MDAATNRTGESYNGSGWSQDSGMPGATAPPSGPAPSGGSPLAQPSPLSQSDLGQAEAGIAGAEKPYQDKLLKLLNDPQAADAHLEKVRDAPNPEDYHKYSREFVSSMAVIGAIAGRFTRQPGNAALNAFTGALKGWQQGNQQAYEDAAKQWEQNSQKTIENNNIELEKYKEILADKKANIDQMMAAITVAGAQYQNSVIYNLAKSGNFTAVAQAVDKMGVANQRLQGAYGQLSDVRADQAAQVRAQVEYLNAHPEQISQLKMPDFLKLKGTAESMGLTLNAPPPGAQFADSPADLSHPQQPPPNVPQKDWDIWADYERYTGKAPNLGWGKEMNAFKAKLSLYANDRQANNVPIDPAARKMADTQAGYAGTVSGARSVGTRGANIEMASNLANYAIPQAQAASDAFPRGKWTPINAAKLKAFEAGSSVELSQWDVANLQIAEMYARALNPTGTTIRKDMMDRAIGVISQAKSPEAYKATLQSIQQAMDREKQGIAATKADLTDETPPQPAAVEGDDEGWGDLKVH
jgi:hypothetical protein